MLTKIESPKGAKLRLLAFLPVLLSVLLVFACQQTENAPLSEEALSKYNDEKNIASRCEAGNVYFTVEDMPIYPGGDLELRKYIAMNVKYPKIAKEQGAEGRIFLQFVVNPMGEVEQVKIVGAKVPDLDTEINEVGEVVVVGYGEEDSGKKEGLIAIQKEALRVIESLPNWTPGKIQGEAVFVSFTVPINFQLK